MRDLKELVKHANCSLQETSWRLYLLPIKSVVVIGCLYISVFSVYQKAFFK